MADYNYPLIVSVVLCLLAIGMTVGYFLDQTEDPETKQKTPKPVYIYVGVVAFVGAWIAALYAYYLETKMVDMAKKCVRVDDPDDMTMCMSELDTKFEGDLSKFNAEKKRIRAHFICQAEMQGQMSRCDGMQGEKLEDCQETVKAVENEINMCKKLTMDNPNVRTTKQITDAFNSNIKKSATDNIQLHLTNFRESRAKTKQSEQQRLEQVAHVQQQQLQQLAQLPNVPQ